MAAILLDIDGVLHVSGEPVPGGGDAVRALRTDGHRLRFVTNTPSGHGSSSLPSRAQSGRSAVSAVSSAPPRRTASASRSTSSLDAGPFVGGLEYAASVEAEVVGKPSLGYVETALDALGARPEEP
jgi:ribonucleotide monophosphatase NagD (HAD superfamily)